MLNNLNPQTAGETCTSFHWHLWHLDLIICFASESVFLDVFQMLHMLHSTFVNLLMRLLLFITCQTEILQWLVSWKWFVANWTLITLLTSYHSVWKIHHILNIYRAFSFHRLQICEFLYSVFLKKLRHKYYIYVACHLTISCNDIFFHISLISVDFFFHVQMRYKHLILWQNPRYIVTIE